MCVRVRVFACVCVCIFSFPISFNIPSCTGETEVRVVHSSASSDRRPPQRGGAGEADEEVLGRAATVPTHVPDRQVDPQETGQVKSSSLVL